MAIERIAAAYEKGGVSGLSTGFLELDQLLGGLQPSDLIIMAGRPSMGKTALALGLAFHIAKQIEDGEVSVYSLEMSASQLLMRQLGIDTGLASDRLRRGDLKEADMERLLRAQGAYDAVPLHINETGGLTLADLWLQARRRKHLKKTVCLIVDYLQIMGGDGRQAYSNRVQEVTALTSGLKALAKALDIPVIVLSQLSRQVENREDKRPQLSDLRESGSIEQDADVVLFVFREEYYVARREPPASQASAHLEWQDDLKAVQGLAEIIVAKHRHGPIGTVKLAFSAPLTRFSNLTDNLRGPVMNRPSIWSWRNAIRKSSLPPLAKLCCYVLADYMSDAGKGCFPSIVTLMKDTGLSNTSIAKHLRLAVEAGLLVKHRFRDRAGHCAGTNYYPRFPERVEEEPAAEPATLGAAAFFDVPEASETAKIEPAARPSRRSPWADYPARGKPK